MSLAMMLVYMPMTAFATGEPNGGGAWFVVNDQPYTTLSAAVAAADTGDTVEILSSGSYSLPKNMEKNITIKGAADSVVFDCTGTGSICSIPNGATFENVTMNFGRTNYHGFQHAGTINMNDCTLNGLLFSYGDMNFNGCTFNAPGTTDSGIADKDYSMWAYGMYLTYTDCTFNCAGKCINVYNEGGNYYKVSFDGCTFNSTVSNKAAVNVKETSGSTLLNRDVEINNCTCNENFPSASSSDSLVVINGLVQVDDRMAGGTPAGGEVTVKVNGTQVYASAEIAKVAQIGDIKYTSLQDALNDAVSAGSDVTVELLDNIDLTGTDWTPVNLSTNKNTVTVEGNNKVIKGLNEMLFGRTWASKGLVIKDLTIKDSNIVHDENDLKGNEGVGAFIGYAEATETVTLDDCHVIGSTVNGGHWVGGFVGVCGGYNNANDGPVFTTLTITGSSVEGCTIINKGSAGSFIGHGAMSAATKVVLDGSATGNSITGEKAAKTGKLIGTIGAGGPEAFNGEKGGIELNVTESGNTGAANVAGRIGTAGGTMIVTGGSYESDPLVTSDNATGTIAAKDGFTVVENNGVFTIIEKIAQVGDSFYGSIADAVKAAGSGDTVTLLADVENTGNISLKAGVILDGNGHKISGTSAVYINKAGGAVKNVTFENIHNSKNRQSAVYAESLEGSLSVTGCTFDNCDWDAIQITPVAGAEIEIKNNVFRDDDSDSIQQQRFVHIQSGKNVDFAATVSENKMYGDVNQGALEAYYFADADKIDLSKNFIEYPEDTCILEKSGTNVTEMILPLYEEDLITPIDIAAQIKDDYTVKLFATLEEAIAAAEDGATVTLLKDSAGNGIRIDKDITIDLGGNTYTVDGNPAGSTGTKTQGFQILKGNDVTIKNGTVTTSAEAGVKMLVQNYADLTLTDVTLDGENLNGSGRYVLSNNSGSVKLDGATSITAKDGDFALDTCEFGSYAAPTVTVDTTGTITGKVEASGGKLDIQNGKFDGSIVAADGYAEGDIAISGGAFKEQPAKEYCADSFLPSGEADADGYYTVVKANEWDEELAAELAEQAEALQNQIDANKALIDALDDTYATDAAVAKAIEDAKAAIEAAQAEIDAAQDAQQAKDVEALNKAIGDAKTALEAADTATLNAAKAYTDEIADSLQEQLDALKAAAATKDELETAITAAEASAKSAQDAIAALSDASGTQSDEIAELQKKVADLLKATNETLEKRVADLEAAVKALQEQNDMLMKGMVRLISTSLSAKVTNYNTVKLTWNTTGMEDVTYTLYLKKKGETKWTKLTEIASPGNGKSMSYTADKLTTGATYYFYAVPSTVYDGQQYKGPNSNTANARPIPGKTSILTRTPGTAKFKITYKQVDGATGYQIKYGRNTFKRTTSTRTYKTVSKLKRNRRFKVYVRAYRTVDGRKVYGKWSKVKYVRSK